MQCPNCLVNLQKTIIQIKNYDKELISYYCIHCGYCDLDANSADDILATIQAFPNDE
ncbi:MAG: hypothetical protein Q7R56_01180 [Nanoarchaeota archaeon]|nr:hypothetical protein [Nanoarchaeota archaeon]